MLQERSIWTTQQQLQKVQGFSFPLEKSTNKFSIEYLYLITI